MKPLFLVISSALMCHIAFAATGPDHLAPVDVNEDAMYRALLLEKLTATPFDCGRVIIKPPFRYGEESISIYSRPTNGKSRRYYVTYMEAADSLRDWSDAGRLPARAQNVKVRRIDAEIPTHVAQLLRQVWIGMLSGRQTPRQTEQPSETFYGDATIAEFSVASDTGNTLCGETPMVPELGSKTKQFLKLSKMLVDYSKATPGERPQILEQVDRQAAQLLEALKA